MQNKKKIRSEQEEFWAGEFGSQYIDRNKSESLLAANIYFFSRALRQADKINSCIEFGANIGMNLKTLKLLYPNMNRKGIEINADAANELKKLLGDSAVYTGSIFEWQCEEPADLCLVKGVLIHINPNLLQEVYKKLYQSSPPIYPDLRIL